ncbi:MAG: S9 family peptidase [Ilumatobacteraceae bacterium]
MSEPRLGVGCVVYGCSVDGVAHLAVHDLPLPEGSDGPLEPDRLLATAPALRPARSLGGGSWCLTLDRSTAVYLAVDGDLWLQPLDGSSARRLTDGGADRSISGPVALADGATVAYTVDMAEVWSVDVGTGAVRRHDDGRHSFVLDVCAMPSSAAGHPLAGWNAWDEPDMPWDHSVVCCSDGTTVVDPPGAVQQVRSDATGSVWCVRDDSGWLNVWRDGRPVVDEPFEHAGPTWGPGQRSYAVSPDGRSVAYTRNEGGFGRLCVATLVDSTVSASVVEVAKAVHGQLDWFGTNVVALRTGGRTPTQVVLYDTRDWSRRTVAVGPPSEWLSSPWRDELIEPSLHEVPVADGVVHARLYSPPGSQPDQDPTSIGLPGRRDVAERSIATQRLIVWLHGGPTDQWQVTFMPRIAYWCSRGWHVLVPDHRGSTGHGRASQQSLRGEWGVMDVEDTLAATRWAHGRGIGTPGRTVLMGGSAGGFTALGAIAADPSLYAAAAVAYPVSDLVDLTERSHRFERHYTDTLVGALPAAADDYRRRSPVWNADRFVTRPLLVLHGDVDPVVPVEQSRVFVDRVRAAGGDAELHVYAGEGHGFRQRATQLDEYERIGRFLERVFGGGGR